MGDIKIGDTGRVNRDEAAMTLVDRAQVIHVPLWEGDVWGFRDTVSQRDIFTTERFTFIRDLATPPPAEQSPALPPNSGGRGHE